MAPSSSPDRNSRLKLTAGSPLAELFVIDSAFAVVKRAIGDLECEVPPGVYKVKAKVGDAVAEMLVALDGDREIDLSPELPLASPAPIAGTTRAGERDMAAAAGASAGVVAHAGIGAQVFVMARAWPGEGTSPDRQFPPPRTSLHRLDGTLVARTQPLADVAAPLTHAVTAELDPGPYLVRWDDDSGVPAEQCIHAVEGWQTQVFVLEEAAEPTDPGRTRVSVLMARDSFDPADPELRLIEEARTALADERKVASESLDAGLLRDSPNPMHLLFAGHLMLVARDAQRRQAQRSGGRPYAPVSFDQPRFDAVVGALREILGEQHPDVVALSTQISDAEPDKLIPVTSPPMLWRSWVLLIRESNAAPSLLPVATWRRTVRLLPLRPFLIWSPADKVEDDDTWIRGVAGALATAERAARRQGADEQPVRDLLSAAQAAASSAAEDDRGVPAADETRRRVSFELLAPRAAVDEIASRPESE